MCCAACVGPSLFYCLLFSQISNYLFHSVAGREGSKDFFYIYIHKRKKINKQIKIEKRKSEVKRHC
jgi:hypothetical protein